MGKFYRTLADALDQNIQGVISTDRVKKNLFLPKFDSRHKQYGALQLLDINDKGSITSRPS
jgi:hypothetical protein